MIHFLFLTEGHLWARREVIPIVSSSDGLLTELGQSLGGVTSGDHRCRMFLLFVVQCDQSAAKAESHRRIDCITAPQTLPGSHVESLVYECVTQRDHDDSTRLRNSCQLHQSPETQKSRCRATTCMTTACILGQTQAGQEVHGISSMPIMLQIVQDGSRTGLRNLYPYTIKPSSPSSRSLRVTISTGIPISSSS